MGKNRLKAIKKDNNKGMGREKYEQNKGDIKTITRIKGKGKNKGTGKVKARSNDKTGVEARALK